MEYIEDFHVFYKTLGVTLLIFGIFFTILSSPTQRILFATFSFFYYMYNGLGIAYVIGVHSDQFNYYWQFYLAFSLGFVFFLKLFLGESIHFRRSVTPFLKQFTTNRVLVFSIITIYMMIEIFPLIYPEFKLYRLVSPPAPDVAKQFYERIANRRTGSFDVIIKLVSNIGFLIYPFYLISLAAFRKSPFTLFLFVFLPLYFHYCNISYINRGRVLEALFIYGAMLWYFSPSYRKYLVIAALVVLPVIPIYLIQYQSIRQGNEASEISSTNALTEIVHAETIMPTFSRRIVNHEKRINKGHYFLWLTTLPIPKVIIGAVPPVSAGVEMSEILLRRKQGQEGYFALLAGLLNESIYTYGKKMFFLHALFLAFLMALVSRFGEFNPYLFPTVLVFIVLFGYTLNRAGVSSVLPVLTNKFLSVYAVLGLHYFYQRFNLSKYT